MPAAGPLLAFTAAIANSAGYALVAKALAFTAVAVSFASAHRQRKKREAALREAEAQRIKDLLQSRRRYIDIPNYPRQIVYGRAAHAGVLTYAAPDRIPTSDSRAQNSLMTVLSARPVDRFVSATLRELNLGDFPVGYSSAPTPGQHDDNNLLRFLVPENTEDPGPRISGPAVASRVDDTTYDAFLLASLGQDDSLHPEIIYGPGESRKEKMRAYGCAWANMRFQQLDPKTGEGISSSGRPDIVWDMLGARVRNFCTQGSGRKILGWRSLADNSLDIELNEIALLAALDDVAGAWGEDYFKLGVLQEPEFGNDVEIWGNAAAKEFRDNMVVAAGGTVVEEPVRGDTVDFISSETADLIGRQTAPLARPLSDFLAVRVEVRVGSSSFVLNFSPAEIISAGAAGVSKKVSDGGDGVLLDSDLVYLWNVGDDLLFDIRSASGATKISTYQFVKVQGLAPISNRAAALAAFRVFLLTAENDTAVRQLHLWSEDVTGASSAAAPAGDWIDVAFFSETTERTVAAWSALPTSFSQNPVLTFADWITDESRPSGFRVRMAQQLALLPRLEDEADYCEELLLLHSNTFGSLFAGQRNHYRLFVWNGARTAFPSVSARVTYQGVTKEVELLPAVSGWLFKCTRHEGGNGGRGSYETTCQRDVRHGLYRTFDKDVVFGAGAAAVTVNLRGDGLFEHAHTVSSKMDVNVYVSNTQDAGKFGGVEFFGYGYGGKGGSVRTTDNGLVQEIGDVDSPSYKAALAATEVVLIPQSGTGGRGVLPVGAGVLILGDYTLTVTRGTDQRLVFSLTDSGGNVADGIAEWWAPRFRFNGIINMGSSERENLSLWEDAVLGDCFDEGGALRLRVARWEPPVTRWDGTDRPTICAEDLVREDDLEMSLVEPLEEVRTGLLATYLDVGQNWRERETEVVRDELARAKSGGVERVESVTMPHANSEWEATAYARRLLAIRRQGGRLVTGLLRWDAVRFERGDRITMDAGLFGFRRVTTWRIESIQYVFSADGPRGVALSLVEDDERAYDDDFMRLSPDSTPGFFSFNEILDKSGAAITTKSGAALSA